MSGDPTAQQADSDQIGTATFVAQKNGHGDGRVYHVDPPHEGWGEGPTEFVWVSAVTLPMGLGCETYIFPCDSDGEVTSWGEMPGSIKNSLDHEEALRRAGYRVTTPGKSSDGGAA